MKQPKSFSLPLNKYFQSTLVRNILITAHDNPLVIQAYR